MIVIEYILGVIGRIFVEIIFEGLIVGSWKLIKRILNFLKYKVFGIQKIKQEFNPIKELEKKLLYKKIELTKNLNNTQKKGQIGAVLEIIDTDTVFVEFYDKYNKQIELDNELVFKIRLNQFKLIK